MSVAWALFTNDELAQLESLVGKPLPDLSTNEGLVLLSQKLSDAAERLESEKEQNLIPAEEADAQKGQCIMFSDRINAALIPNPLFTPDQLAEIEALIGTPLPDQSTISGLQMMYQKLMQEYDIAVAQKNSDNQMKCQEYTDRIARLIR